MNRSALPTAACTDSDALPVVDCPTDPPVAYSYDVQGQWLEDFFGLGETLMLGTVAPLDPEPASLTMDTMLNLAVEQPSIPPEVSEIPTSWQQFAGQDLDPSQPVAAMLPLVFIPFLEGTPFWLRYDFTDDKGCVTTAVGFFPEGIPGSWEDDVSFYVSVAGADFQSITVPGGGDPSNTFAVEDQAGVCPPPARAVAVTAACGQPIPVTFEASGDPTEVTGVDGQPVVVTGDGEGGELTVEGTVTAKTGFQQADSLHFELDVAPTEPAAIEAIPAGWSQIQLGGYGAAGLSMVRVCIGSVCFQLESHADVAGLYRTLVIDAPPGLTIGGLAGELRVENGSPTDAAGLAANIFYPPA